MKLGIIGAGLIAEKVTKTLELMPEIETYAIGSRNIEKAEVFAKKHGYEKAYGSYEELYNDPQVELVYICTPHSEHCKNMIDAINAGKNVICEKAMTQTADELRRVAKLAKEKHVYVAEAMWVRYMPSRRIIEETLNSGIIGNVRVFSGFLSYSIMDKERIMRKDLAGGALLDIGIYGVNYMLMYLGDDIKKINATVTYTDTGVDKVDSITAVYNDGRVATLVHSIECDGCREGIFQGEKGHMVVDNINNPSRFDVYDNTGNLILHKDLPIKYTGYEYEFEEAVSQIQKGETQSKSITLDESIRMMEICDQIRAAWNKEE